MKHASAKKVDMLHGPLFMKILVFALPLAASSVLQQLFNSVDVMVVGRFTGPEALAAVGSNAPVISLLINLFMGISMGANVVISNHIGQRDDEGIRHAVRTVTLVSLLSGVFLAILGFVVARPILTLMDTPDNVLDLAVTYLRIYFLGIPFFLIFNFGSAILRSLGDTRRPLYILVVAGVVNTVLNLVFVICFGMGVAGVAIATGIANAVSAGLIVRLLRREEEPYRLHLRQMKIYGKQLRRMLQIGVPAGLQGMIFSFSNVLLQSAINGYGSSAIAGSAAAQNFEYYCYFLIVGFNGAAISFIGQNYGAGLMHRVRRIFFICLGMGVVCCLVGNVVFVLFHDFFLNFFSTDPEVHHFGAYRMEIVLLFQWMACSYEITGASLRGMGRSMFPTVMVVFGTCFLRIAWLVAVCPVWPGFDRLMTVYPVSWVITGTLVCVPFYFILRKESAKKPLQTV